MFLRVLFVSVVFITGILHVSCSRTKNLAFVIDDTRSMADDIEQVRREVDGIMDVVYKNNEIDEIVLITFNDPKTKVRKKTKDRDELKEALGSIRTHNYNNYDCPEYSLSGIELALFESKPGSHIYVFTDASAKDYKKVDKIKDLCQKTQTQVIFVLTGDCHRPSRRNYQVYYEVATASSGLVIEVDKQEVNLVVKTIGNFIEGKWNPMTSVIIPPHQVSEVPFTVDDKTQSVIISTSGKDVKMYIRGPRADTDTIMWTKNSKMIQLNNPDPGNYTVSVKGASSTYVVAYGRTDFTFQHGFSETEPKTIDDTSRQPIANENNYLSVSVNDPEGAVKIETAQILSMDEKTVINEMPLKELKDNYYITEPFVSPDDMFKIAVNGHVISTGKPIRRIAKTPIQPQIVVRPVLKKPEVTIREGAIYTAIYGSTVILTCKVHGYPDPAITWRDDQGNVLFTQSSPVEKPYDFISYLHLSNVTRGETYSCHAFNRLGRDAKSIDVNIGDPFNVSLQPEETTLAKYGESTSIKCLITSESEMKINWYFKNGIHSQKLFTSNKYTISSDGTELIINSMKKDLIGTYTCNAALVNDDYIHKKFSTEVEMYGYDVPYIAKSTPYLNVEENKPITVPCTIRRGEPKPKVSWQFKDIGGFVDVDTSKVAVTDEGLHITQAQLLNSGVYKCIAQNDAGSDESETTLNVYTKPYTKIYPGTEIYAKYDDTLEIECDAIGYPLPNIVWRYENGNEIPSYLAKGISDRFEQKKIVKLQNLKKSVKLYCNSNNLQGEDVQAIRVIVPPTYTVANHPEDVTPVSYGKEAIIACDIKSDMPMKINWYFVKENSEEKVTILPSEKYSLLSSGTILKISSVDLNLAGKYTCEASLISDEKEKISFDTKVQIQDLIKPKIQKLPPGIKVMENSPALIECPILEGHPTPTITWQFQERGTYEFKPISQVGEVLIIPNAGLDDFGHYRCIASNPLGQDVRITDLSVETAPLVAIVEGKSIEVAYGSSHLLTCTVTAYPPPKILWTDDKGEARLKTPSENYKHTYELGVELIEIKKSRHLDCHAENVHGNATESIEVIVKSPFTVTETPEATATVDYSKSHTIKCQITSPFKMKIHWYRLPETKGRRMLIKSSDKYSISPDETELTIKSMDVGLKGRYQCKASLIEDDSENISYTTNVKIGGLVPPEINKTTKVIKVNQNANEVISCSILKGSPKPNIMWFFKTDPLSEPNPINGTGELLWLSRIKMNMAGYYLCMAENIQGKDQHYTRLIVEAPPKILQSADTTYSAIVGDIVLKLVCNATGYPKPTITWKVNGDSIIPDSKYAIVDGALLVRTPTEKDTKKYTCVAKSSLGEDTVTFDGIVTNELLDYENIHKIHMLEGTSKKIICLLPHSDSDKVTWFLNGDVLNKTTPYVFLENSDISMAGNYSCRVSTENGNSLDTYEVEVGFPPRFKSYQDDPVFDWEGDGILDCDADAIPEATAEWFYEGKPLKAAKTELQLSINKWGQYRCIVSNVHGTERRSFNVTSSGCLINRRKDTDNTTPLMLTENLKWPIYETRNDFLLIPHQEKLIVSCHNRDEAPNSLTLLPGRSAVEATCAGRDTFWIDGTLYSYSDLHCEREITPVVKRTGEQCLSDNTELIRVGYQLDEFVEVYTICFDTKNNVPLFSQQRMLSSNNIISPTDSKWFNSLDLPSQNNDIYTCENSSAKCCITKEQLVSGNDVIFGPPRQSTYINNLNSIPVWTHCDDSRTTWRGIEDILRSQYVTNPEFAVWSGATNYNNSFGRNIPEYLWKVVRFDEIESLAIIYVNDPHPKESQVLCRNLCAANEIPWIKINDKYTYCCELSEFLTAFNLPEEVVGGL